MKPINGQIPYDLFIANAPIASRVQACNLDFGNMEVGGGKPQKYLHGLPRLAIGPFT